MEKETDTKATSQEMAAKTVAQTSPFDQTLKKILILLALLLLGLIVLFCFISRETADTIRDIAVVFFVLESLVTLVTLIVLVKEFIRFIEVMKHDVKPIIKTADETVRNVKGTVVFLGDNLIEPTIEAGSKAAGFSRAVSSITSIFKR